LKDEEFLSLAQIFMNISCAFVKVSAISSEQTQSSWKFVSIDLAWFDNNSLTREHGLTYDKSNRYISA